eukprot:6212761-Pleurochrysis_carterae.AAC.2
MTKKGKSKIIKTPDSVNIKTWSAESELGKALFDSDLGTDSSPSRLSPVSVTTFFNIDACDKKQNWLGVSVKTHFAQCGCNLEANKNKTPGEEYMQYPLFVYL